MKIREDFADTVRRTGQKLRGLSTEEIAERCNVTPEEAAKMKKEWQEQHPELVTWFSRVP